MSQVSDRDVEAIRDWLNKEPYMPKNFDDLVLKKFLFSCDCSLERTKKCLEEFCIRRANMPEVYTNRDPTSKRVQNVFSYTHVTTYLAGVDEVLIHRITDASNFDFYDSMKTFTLIADNWINYPRNILPENHIVVLDIKQYTLSLVAKVNTFFFQKFVLYLLESMPVRLKEVHVINCPSFYEYMYNLVKPALPEYLCKMINFHPNYTALHKFIDKKYLPKDYDGDCESMAEQHATWVSSTEAKRQVTTYMAGVDEVLIHQLTDIPTYFDFYDCLKAFTVVADNWINYHLDILPENHIVVLDIKLYTLSLVPKVNIFYFQKFILFLLESMPVRLKEVHVINCPSFYEYLYNLVKPALPEYLYKMINFHPDHMGLHKFIDKKYLPKDFDGESQSMAEQHAYWVTYAEERRNLCLDDNYWKADLSKKPKNGVVDNSMSGSFRTLAID